MSNTDSLIYFILVVGINRTQFIEKSWKENRMENSEIEENDEVVQSFDLMNI